MPIEVIMPKVDMDMVSGTFAVWHIAEGALVEKGAALFDIETDKSAMEVESPATGHLHHISASPGQVVAVGTAVGWIYAAGEVVGAAPSTNPHPAEAETSGSAAPVPASDAGLPSRSGSDAVGIRATPLARRLAREAGIALEKIAGSGPHGRIQRADIEAVQNLAAAVKADAAPTPAPVFVTPAQADAAPATAPTGPVLESLRKIYAGREFEEVALDGMRKIIAARLTEAKSTIPHFYLRRDIQLDALMAFRAQLNNSVGARGIKLSINDFIIKACALALQDNPDCNAVWAGDRVLKMKASDVAVAVAIEGGLFTPVLRDAEFKSLSKLSAEMKDLAARARARKLALHEYQGGSFAISNLGMMGIDNFDAIISPPHASILAVGAGVRKPVCDATGEIVVATIMSVTLSVDHRVIDGALGAQFLTSIKTYLESPMNLVA